MVRVPEPAASSSGGRDPAQPYHLLFFHSASWPAFDLVRIIFKIKKNQKKRVLQLSVGNAGGTTLTVLQWSNIAHAH